MALRFTLAQAHRVKALVHRRCCNCDDAATATMITVCSPTTGDFIQTQTNEEKRWYFRGNVPSTNKGGNNGKRIYHHP